MFALAPHNICSCFVVLLRVLSVHKPMPTTELSLSLTLAIVLQVKPRELVVPPGDEASVAVRVLLDDATAFRDTLHVLVAEGADVSVPLEAAGVGNTVVSEVLSQARLDFGPQFVGRGWQMEVEVTNMGRKAVTLSWTNRRMAEVLDTLNKAAKASGGWGVHVFVATTPRQPDAWCLRLRSAGRSLHSVHNLWHASAATQVCRVFARRQQGGGCASPS